MTVKEFIACLKNFPPDVDVVISPYTFREKESGEILVEVDRFEMQKVNHERRAHSGLDIYLKTEFGDKEVLQISSTY